MFYLKYTEAEFADGSGKLKNKLVEYDNLEAVQRVIKNNNGHAKYSNIAILTNVENQIDYKKMFEELYDFVLKGAGIRTVSIPERPETRVIDS